MHLPLESPQIRIDPSLVTIAGLCGSRRHCQLRRFLPPSVLSPTPPSILLSLTNPASTITTTTMSLYSFSLPSLLLQG